MPNIISISIDPIDQNDSYEEWIILKKVFYKEQSQSLSASPNTGFFASKLQKTKQSLTKFSNTLIHQGSKEKHSDSANKSLNSSTNSLNSNCSASNFQASSATSFSSSNLADLNEFHAGGPLASTVRKSKPKFATVQSSFYLNNLVSWSGFRSTNNNLLEVPCV
jgi:hypothetical protein